MRATEVLAIKECLEKNNLPVPFGFVLEPESFEELLSDLTEWARDYFPKSFSDTTPVDPKQPFEFGSFWFERSDTPDPRA